jgi:anti-anti-sigma factor
MQLTVTKLEGNVLIVAVRGALDTTTAGEFNQRIAKLVDTGFDRVILDASQLTYISSMGVGTLMTLHARMRRRGGHVALAGLHGPAFEVFQMLRLDRLMAFHPDVQHARAAMR